MWAGHPSLTEKKENKTEIQVRSHQETCRQGLACERRLSQRCGYFWSHREFTWWIYITGIPLVSALQTDFSSCAKGLKQQGASFRGDINRFWKHDVLLSRHSDRVGLALNTTSLYHFPQRSRSYGKILTFSNIGGLNTHIPGEMNDTSLNPAGKLYLLLIPNFFVWRIKTWRQVFCLSQQITPAQVCVAEIKYGLISQAHLPSALRCKIHSVPCIRALYSGGDNDSAHAAAFPGSGFRLTVVGLLSFNKNILVSALQLLQRCPCKRNKQLLKFKFNHNMSDNFHFPSKWTARSSGCQNRLPDLRFDDLPQAPIWFKDK